MNVRSLITVDYENIANWTLGENKPNSNPIKPNTNPIQTQYKAKTNPIKPNFKRDTLLLCGALLRTSFAGMTILLII
jgi:hypothetical protein